MEASEITVEDGDTVVFLKGDALIDDAAEIHRRMVEAVDTHRSLVIDVSNITQCDVSFLQILLSCGRTLAAGGRTLKLRSDPVPTPVCETVVATGFSCSEFCSFHTDAGYTCGRTEDGFSVDKEGTQ